MVALQLSTIFKTILSVFKKCKKQEEIKDIGFFSHSDQF